VRNIYECPLNFQGEGVDEFVLDHFGLTAPPPDLDCWRALTQRARDAAEVVRIAIVGKYVELEDAYLSVAEALRHAGFREGCGIEIDWVDSEPLVDGAAERLAEADGILIPGGFGSRGFEGKIEAARFARESGVPYLGICFGMHVVVCEFARHRPAWRARTRPSATPRRHTR